MLNQLPLKERKPKINKVVVETTKNNNSFIPALKECEKFIFFCDDYFKLNLKKDYVITINKASKKALAHFMPKEHIEHFTNTTQDLNNINLNTYYIKDNCPYIRLLHELSHFVNYSNKIKDCSSNQYHNKKFKIQAEKFLLKVSRTDKNGYSYTEGTEEFDKMLKIFKPNKEVFNIFQNKKDNKKTKSRQMIKYSCDCAIIRTAEKDLKYKCLKCGCEVVKDE